MAQARADKRAFWILGGLFAATLGLLTKDYVFNRHRVTMTIEVLDAPAECWSTLGRKVSQMLSPRRRDFAPTRGAIVHWCGGAITDAGYYRLPETHMLNIFDTRRAKLLDTLQEGCRYDVTVVGIGGRQNPKRPRVPVTQRISRVHRELGCKAPGP